MPPSWVCILTALWPVILIVFLSHLYFLLRCEVVPPTAARVGLLLGAGNQGILSFCDALHMLFIENMTCIVKHNPVRAYIHTWMKKIFAPLIAEGVFASVLGGIDESKVLLADPRVEDLRRGRARERGDAPGSARTDARSSAWGGVR